MTRIDHALFDAAPHDKLQSFAVHHTRPSLPQFFPTIFLATLLLVAATPKAAAP
jgi:hypothetical protein